MAATRNPRSSAAAAADHHRFLRPGALARLRDAKLRRRKPNSASRLAPPSSPSSPSPAMAPAPSSPAPAAAAGDGAVVPYFVPFTRLLAPRCPQRKKLAAAKGVMLFAPPPPSPDLPVEVAAMEFLTSPDMVVAAH
uniref:Uncharacterized protein n=1 Tax=Leersia perrieri TaxID=77586 RepID=A0A0D9W9R7_9ORYZ